MSAESPTLAVVVISHGHERFLPRCLGSLPAAIQGVDSEVLLVDNLNSGDIARIASGSPVPVRVHTNATPFGFAKNCNNAVRSSSAPFILLLNPDTAFLSGKLADGIAAMRSDPAIGIVGAKLVNEEGVQQQSYRHYPTAPVFLARALGVERWTRRPAFYRHSMMEGEQFTSPATVDLVTGACFLLRRECFDAIGGFDEGFFMYWEDADFCYRARRQGFRTCFYPGITVLHHHQRDSRRITSAHARWHISSAIRFFRKHGVLCRAGAESA